MPYTEHVMRRVWKPTHNGPLEGATHTGLAGTPGGGPHIRIELVLAEGRIQQARYGSNGCPASIACAHLVCELIEGRDQEFAHKLEPGDLISMLGGLPDVKRPKADLAIQALRKALDSQGCGKLS